MRARVVAVAALLQVALLAFMAGEREWVLRFGRPIRLRTAPIDPNDPMRGEYARFNYELSSVPSSLWRDGLPALLVLTATDYRAARDLRVFAAVRLDDDGVAELVSLSDRPPAGGLYLRGRVNSVNNQRVSVRYGIEAMFMEQGAAKKLEDARRQERPGAPIDAEVSVSPSGLAVLKGYHWEPLGIVATFVRANIVPATTPPAASASANGPARPRPLPPRQFVATANVELKNYGAEDIAIVDLPDGGSYRLVPDTRGQEIHYHWVGENQPMPRPSPAQVIVLKPGQSHVTKIDLLQPRWFVTDSRQKTGQPQPMALRDVTETWAASFRLEYSPSAKTEVEGLPHAELVHFGRLRSRAFNPTQNLD